MSFNFEEQYCTIQINSADDGNEMLARLLDEFAESIHEHYQATGEHPEHFYSIEQELPVDRAECIKFVTPELMKYVESIATEEQVLSITLRYEYDSDAYDENLFDDLCKFFFSKSKDSYFLVSSCAFDNSGSCSNQWVGYEKDGEIVLEHTSEYFKRLSQQSPAPVLTAS